MITPSRLGLILVSATTMLTACKARKTTATPENKTKSVCENMAVTYTADVKPIIDANCGNSCHSAQKRASGIDLSNYESVREEAKKVRFMGAINHQAPFSPMPKKHPKLSDSTIQVLQCWIDNGSKQ